MTFSFIARHFFSFVYWYILKLFTDKQSHWNNNNLTSLAVEIADDLGLECFSSLPPSDGLLSAARGIFGDVLGLLFVEEGWDDIRGKEAVLCAMVCTAGRLRGVRVLPETKMITSIRVHSHLRFIRRELLHELFSPRNHEKLAHNPLLNFSVNVKVDQIVIVNAPTYNSTTHYLVNSSRLINRWCEWTLTQEFAFYLLKFGYLHQIISFSRVFLFSLLPH